jgi:hypothetical protein
MVLGNESLTKKREERIIEGIISVFLYGAVAASAVDKKA